MHEKAGIESTKVRTKSLDLTHEGLAELEQALIDDGFNPSDDNAVKSVSVNGTALPKVQGNVNLVNASTENAGLMSPQDKIALGSLQPNINISGSGVTKNAASFNFLPTNTAADNNIAIANALNGGGTILVDLPGIYDISDTIVIPSNTTLIFGANTFVRMNANKYAVLNVGAHTRVYDENIKLVGFHLIANGYNPPIIDIYNVDPDIIVGLHGYVNFFYVKHLVVYEYVILDQGDTGYGLHIATSEDVVIERVHIKGEKDGIHISSRTKRVTIKDCISQCYDDGCTMNAVDYVTSTPEVGWIEDVLVDNCYDLVHPEHNSDGFYSRFMGGAWKDWEEGTEVMLGSIVVVESEGVKRIYRVVGHQHEMGWKFISHTQPSATTIGQIEFLDEQEVTRTIGGVTQTATMRIPWILYQTQGVGYEGGCRNITFRNIHLQKTRTFIIQYYMDDLWFNAIVPNAQGNPVMRNITFDHVYQEYEGTVEGYPRFVTINCPTQNIRIQNCYIKHRVLVNANKLNIEGLIYPEATLIFAGNVFSYRDDLYLSSFGTGDNNYPNRVRLYGNILENSSCTVQQDGTVFIQNDIIL